jgi:predicted xylan-binding protein with Ca-dependent carbohydrate-binding module
MRPIRSRSASRRPLAAAGLAALALLAPATAHAASPLEAETLAPAQSSAGGVVADTAASAGRALKLWSNVTASGRVSLTQPAATLSVRARGQQCAGAPLMHVSVDGVRLLSAAVTATGYTTSIANLPIVPGAHTVAVTFANDYKSATCDRNLIVDRLALSETAPPAPGVTPPPPPALP